MGRQINFYMNKEVEQKFMEYVLKLNFCIIELDRINKKLNYITKVDELNLIKYINIYIYNKEYGEISFWDDKLKYTFDHIINPVIQFSRTTFNEKEKTIGIGRIWYEHKYYADDGLIVEKDIRLLKDYEKLVRWIKKNVPYQIIDRGTIDSGPFITKDYVNDDLKGKYEGKYRFTN